MADVFVYAPNCTDFDNIGEAGSLTPFSCIHTEIKNGMSEIEIVSPIDEMGKWSFLQNEYILSAEVPVRTTPEISSSGALITTIERWTVRLSAHPAERRVYSKEVDGKVVTTPKWGATVTVVKKGTERYKIKTGRYTGWIAASALENQIIETIPNDPNAIQDAVPPWTIRPQQFRVYKVEKTGDEVTVLAKHVFYDQAKNVTSYAAAAPTCVQAVNGLVAGCVFANTLNGMSNMLDTRAAVKWENVGFVEALLDPDTGLVNHWGAELVRDNEEFVVLREAGQNRGVVIEYGKNLNGIDMTLDYSSVVTRYIPIGLTAKDKPLLLEAGTYNTDHGTIVIAAGQKWIDAPNIGDYMKPYAEPLDLTGEVKAESTSAADIRNAREKMIDLVLAKYENELVNYPKVTMNVDFIQLGDTEEFAQYRQLEDIYLYDRVTIRHPEIAIDILAEVTEYRWDVLRQKADRITLGNVNPASIGRQIPRWRLPDEIPGTKIGKWTVGPGVLGPGAIGDGDQIAPGVIDPTHLTPDVEQWREQWFNDLAIPLEEAIGNAEGRIGAAEDRLEDAEGNIVAVTHKADLIATDMTNVKGDISTIQQQAGEIVLAVSGKLDADDPASSVQTSGVDIKPGIVSISTPVFAVNVEGNNGDMSIDEDGLSINLVNSPSVVPRYLGATVLYVKKDATDAEVAAGNYFRSFAQALSTVTGKYLPNGVTIASVTADTYSEGKLYVRGVIGASLRVDGNGSTLKGTSFQFISCAVQVSFAEFTLYQMSATEHGVLFEACAYGYVVDCVFVALATATNAYGAVLAQAGSSVYVTACQFYGLWRAILVRSASSAVSYNNKGNARLSVSAGTIIAEGTQPNDVTTFSYARGAGGMLSQVGTVTVDQGTATPDEPELATLTVDATTVHTVYGSAEWPGSWMSITNTAWQGYNPTNKYMAMLAWFGSALAALAGKTIVDAKLRLKRVTGTGVGGAVNVKGYYGNLAYNAGSGSPSSRVSMGVLGTISNGETDEFPIPVAAISHLAGSTTGRCIALHPGDSAVLSGKDYSANYAKFDGMSGTKPQLIITYVP